MKDQIKNLITFHKVAKQECYSLLEELTGLRGMSMSDEDLHILEISIIKAEEELCWRGVFISDLEDLL